MTPIRRLLAWSCSTLLASATALHANLLPNGSFEQGTPADGGALDSWTVSGNPFGYLTHAPAYVASDGTRMAVFNGGGNVFNGVISREMPTTAGETYTLSFDQGITGTSGRKQRLLVSVTGSANLLSQTLDITATGTPSVWVARTFTFIADGPSATLSFADGSAALPSTATGTADLLLDDVRLATPSLHTLEVSSTPARGVAVSCLPADRDGATIGTTDFTRRYLEGATVNLEAPRFTGTYAFRLWRKDGVDLAGGERGASVTMDADHTLTAVYAENQPPVATGESYAAPQDQELAIEAPGLLANDLDADGDTLTATLAEPPAHGTCTVNPDGSFRYTPASGYSGSDSFTYVASDGGLASAATTVTLAVNAANAECVTNGSFEAGAVVAGSVTAIADWTVTGNPFGYLSDATYTAPDGSRIAVFNGGTNTYGGTLSQTLATVPGTTYQLEFQVGIAGLAGKKQRLGITATGTTVLLTKTEDRTAASGPAQWSVVRASFTADRATTVLAFSDQSAALGSTAAQSCDLLLDRVSVRSTPANRAPTASADRYETLQDRSLDIAAPGVLANDSDPDGGTLTATLASPPAHGTLELASSGGFTYTPTPGFSGEDRFTYTASDSRLASNPTTVTLTIAPATANPVANGSFEAGAIVSGGVTAIDGWTVTGNPFGYVADSAYTATDGSRLAVFNGGNNTFSGTISQTFATIAGKAYRLELDAGVIGSSARRQRLGILVEGAAQLATKTEELATSGSAARWSPVALTFVADGPATTLKLSDLSATLPSTQSSSSDLLVDRVRVSQVSSAKSLRVVSSVLPNVAVTVTPPDLGGKSDGTTAFERIFESGTRVSLAAPATSGNATFVKWTRNGNDVSSEATLLLMLDADAELAAVYRVDNAPRATDDRHTVDEDAVLSIPAPGVLANDSDPNALPLSATLVTPPAHGHLELQADGSFTFTPSPQFHGQDGFTYRADNGTETSNPASVEIAVLPVNDPPAAVAASVLTREDESVALTLEGSDPDSDTLAWTIVTPPAHGSLSGTPPRLTYTPTPDYHGEDQLEFTLSDGSATSGKAVVSIEVTPVADAPIARPGSVTLAAGTSTPVILAGTDADGEALTFTVVSGPAQGSLSGTPPNLVYTPVETHVGADSLTFTVSDGASTSPTATVGLTITEVLANGGFEQTTGTDPNLVPSAWTVTGNHQVKTSPTPREGTRLLAFNTGNTSPNALLSQTFPTTPGHPYRLQFDIGVQAFNTSQQRMRISLNGSAALFSIVESLGGSGSTGNAVTTWTSKSYSFVATSQTTTLQFKDESIATAGIDLLLDKVRVTPQLSRQLSVASSSIAAATITLSPADLSGNSGGVATFNRRYLAGATVGLSTPTSLGEQLFRKWTKNGEDWSSSPSTQLTLDTDLAVTAVYSQNEAPKANPDAWSLAEDARLEIAAPGVMANDSDSDGQPLTVILESPPAHGTLTLDPGGSFTYVPDQDYHGGDSFRYHVRDGLTRSDTTTVSIEVTPVNDLPVARAQTLAIDEDGRVEILLAGDDVEAGPITFVAESPKHGTLSGTAPRLWYTPAPDFHGADAFQFTIDDGSGVSTPAMVTIEVRPINDAPAAHPLHLEIDEDESIAIHLTGSDPEGSPLTYMATPSSHGTWIGSAPNLVYTPAPDFHGSDQFTFRTHDGSLESDEVTVTIRIRPVNDAPVASSGSARTDQDQPLEIRLEASDPEGSTLAFTIKTPPQRGVLSGVPPLLVYAPAAGFHGSDSFVFTVTDPDGGSAEATVELGVERTTVPLFAAWLESSGLTAADGEDPDADSIPNTIEYVIGGDPASASDGGLLPTATLVDAGPDGASAPHGFLLFTYRRSDRAMLDASATIVIERSDHPADGWEPADGRGGEWIVVEDDAADHGVDQVKVFIPRSGTGPGFARLRAMVGQP